MKREKTDWIRELLQLIGIRRKSNRHRVRFYPHYPEYSEFTGTLLFVMALVSFSLIVLLR